MNKGFIDNSDTYLDTVSLIQELQGLEYLDIDYMTLIQNTFALTANSPEKVEIVLKDILGGAKVSDENIIVLKSDGKVEYRKDLTEKQIEFLREITTIPYIDPEMLSEKFVMYLEKRYSEVA